MNYDVLKRFWSSQGVSTAGGATEEELQRLENKYQIRILGDFRDYLSFANGMRETDNCDANMFYFWPLSKLKPVREECPDIPFAEGYENYFVFADYMIWCWAYAINLDDALANAGEVVLIGGNRQQRIAGSFAEFLALYMEDSPSIYAAA